MNPSKKDSQTSSLLLKRFGSKVRLQGAAPTPGVKSVLKVKTLDESLRTCLKKRSSRRGSLTLASLGSSLRNVFGSIRAIDKEDPGALSHHTGMDLLRPEEPTEAMNDSTSSFCHRRLGCRKVQFSTIERRFYPVAPSDNPAVSGHGPAIALHGWKFKTEPCQGVNDYEKDRPPRKTQENLKLDMMDRRQRLLEHGASNQEMQVFAKRVGKAKKMRAETVEAFSLYGKRHLVREEKKENTKRFLQKLFRMRKHQSEELVELWDQAQKPGPATQGKDLASTA